MVITLTVNEKIYKVEIEPGTSLLDVLREQLHLTGTKCACKVGECGACTVLVDGKSVDSCIYLAIWANGKTIETIEGECKNGELSKIQQAYIDENAVQCGFCTPGLVMSTKALLNDNPHPTEEEIKRGLSGNMCRCTGYQNIVKAVKKISE